MLSKAPPVTPDSNIKHEPYRQLNRAFRRSRIIAVALLMVASQATAYAAKKDLKAPSMMGENISGGFGDFHIESKEHFTKKNREIIWFSGFKGFMSAYKANLKADWIAPSGEIFKSEHFTTEPSNCRFGWAKLDIKGKDSEALKLEGRWTVNIYWDDELIDTKKFYIDEKKSTGENVEAATVANESSLNEPAPLKANKYYVGANLGDGEINSGIAWWTKLDHLNNTRNFFSPDDKAIVWVAEYPNFSSPPDNLEVTWYRPDGTIFEQSRDTIYPAGFIRRHMMLVNKAIAKKAFGKWKVEARVGDALVDSRYFFIDYMDKLKRLPLEELKPVTSKEEFDLVIADMEKKSRAPRSEEANKDFLRMGETYIPIVADTKDLLILKMGNEYFSTPNKTIGEGSDNATLKLASECSALEAQDYFAPMNRNRAAGIYEKCVEKAPTNPAANRAAGLFDMLLDDYDGALKRFSKAKELMPDDPIAKEQYGDALMLNLRNDEAKAQYEDAIQSGHHDPERIQIKIRKLTPKKDLSYIKQYLLNFTGIAVEDTFPAYFLYADSKAKPNPDTLFYKTGNQPKNIALINKDKIIAQYSAWKKLKEYQDIQKKEFNDQKIKLETEIKQSKDDASLKVELARMVTTHEAVRIVALNSYSKKITGRIQVVAEDFAKKNGYDAAAFVNPGVDGKDVTDEIVKMIDEDISLIVPPDEIMRQAQGETKLRESHLLPDSF